MRQWNEGRARPAVVEVEKRRWKRRTRKSLLKARLKKMKKSKKWRLKRNDDCVRENDASNHTETETGQREKGSENEKFKQQNQQYANRGNKRACNRVERRSKKVQR